MQPEKRLQRGTIKKILKEAFRRRLQLENAQFNRDVLDSLQDLTGLKSAELTLIARKVAGEADVLSSIRRQILLTGAILLVLPVLPMIWFFTW